MNKLICHLQELIQVLRKSSANRRYSVYTRSQVVTKSQKYAYDGASSVMFINTGDEDILINGVIPLTTTDAPLSIGVEIPHVLKEQFTVKFAGGGSNPELTMIFLDAKEAN